MDKLAIKHALASDQVVDITTTGKRSGRPRRIEIWYHRVDGRYFICGLPGEAHNPGVRRPRDWLANLIAHPEFEFHLKTSATATLPARARRVTDPAERKMVMTAPQTAWYRGQGHELEDLIDNAPLVEITFAGC